MSDPTAPTEQYLVFIVESEWDPATTTPEDWRKATEEHAAFSAAVRAAGAEVVDGEALETKNRAISIRPASAAGPAVFTDGPFGETKELITGYYKIKTRDLAQAKELAALCPTGGHIELWPVMTLPTM